MWSTGRLLRMGAEPPERAARRAAASAYPESLRSSLLSCKKRESAANCPHKDQSAVYSAECAIQMTRRTLIRSPVSPIWETNWLAAMIASFGLKRVPGGKRLSVLVPFGV